MFKPPISDTLPKRLLVAVCLASIVGAAGCRMPVERCRTLSQWCPDYALGCGPPDLGAETNNFFGAMGYQAEGDDFVIYDFEWQINSATESPELAKHLDRIFARMAIQPFPIVVEPTGEKQLDDARRQRVLELVRGKFEGAIAHGQPIAVVNHLGPTSRVVHLPQPRTSTMNKGIDFAGPAVVGPEQMEVALASLEQRVIIGDSRAEGQFSDSYGLQGFTIQQFGGNRGNRGGGRQGGGGGGGGGFNNGGIF